MKEYITTSRISTLMENSTRKFYESDFYKRRCIKYRLEGAGKDARRRHHTKRRRGLGFKPLNQPFPGSVAHHINAKDVIYMPSSIHQSIPHSLLTGYNLTTVNEIAILYL